MLHSTFYCLLNHKVASFQRSKTWIYTFRTTPNETRGEWEGETHEGRTLNLLDELAEVLARQLASRPITHTVAVERVRGSGVGFDGA